MILLLVGSSHAQLDVLHASSLHKFGIFPHPVRELSVYTTFYRASMGVRQATRKRCVRITACERIGGELFCT